MYNREKAVQYSNEWWNRRNPQFISFENDCTNFISQCLFAGGLPQERRAYRNQGWWMDQAANNWSFSWSVAHSLRWYLISSGRGKEVADAMQLVPGDVIFYDFDGNGVFQHSTFVVEKNEQTLYVNAHTSDSYHRNYLYTDSTAYTPNCKYSFIAIQE